MKKSNYLTDIVLIICAIIITALVVRREFFAQNEVPKAPVKPILVKGIAQKLGMHPDPENKIKIIEFMDYECPFCREQEKVLKKVVAAYPDKVSIHRYHLPLDKIHPNAYMAANGAECAKELGFFDQYHDTVFKKETFSQPKTDWKTIAEGIGVKQLNSFVTCQQDTTYKLRIEAHRSVAKEFGIHGVPTIVIKDKLYSGSLSFEQIKEAIDIKN
ncbi:MAG: thioredoxin domain-containing protein [Bacteroidetes Order II. Incertae sedis bacterium]|nr:thioredoxin domain-containing protein [Bacteroidetes Order II. bacterium]